MLFGSVPSPPKKPKSWARTQSARHNTASAMTAARLSHGRDLGKPGNAATANATPRTASPATTTRFTAKPCARTREPNPETRSDSAFGCGVVDIDWTIEVSDPG